MHKDGLRKFAFAGIGPLVFALTLGGCSTPSFDLFGSKSSASTDSTTQAGIVKDDDVECPDITIRSGAATLTITGKATPSEGSTGAMDLRYQGSIVRTARECHVRGTDMTMKIGIEGRIVLGPLGGPGQLEVPLRYAVVQEGPSPKTVMSKLARIPVTINPGENYANFTHVDQDVVFPLPRPLGLIDAYVVYIGFDPNAGPVEKPKPAAKPKKKR